MKLMKFIEKKKFILFLSLYISLLTAQMCHFFVHDFCKKEKNKQVEYQKSQLCFGILTFLDITSNVFTEI